jgi:hypothetical protein
VHGILLTHGKPCPFSDLFGLRGRQLLANHGLPEVGAEPPQLALAVADPAVELVDQTQAGRRRSRVESPSLRARFISRRRVWQSRARSTVGGADRRLIGGASVLVRTG